MICKNLTKTFTYINENGRFAVIKGKATHVMVIMAFLVKAALCRENKVPLAQHRKLKIGQIFKRAVQRIGRF